jgi:hypothetical protein
VKKLFVLGGLFATACLLGTSGCSRDAANGSAIQRITDGGQAADGVVAAPASYVADSALRPSIVDTTSIALPMGSGNQVWTLAKTNVGWYSLSVRKDHWTLVYDLDIRCTDPSDSTLDDARAFVAARGGAVTSESSTKSGSIRYVHVDLFAADGLRYVPESAPLATTLAEYAREGTFIHSMALPDDTPISQSIVQ